jgi:hypothetical protein
MVELGIERFLEGFIVRHQHGHFITVEILII